jgi:large conductance mechanosensitive channel
MLKDFRNFVTRGKVLDLAVAVIIGGAVGRVVTSLVNDIVMPPIGLLLGDVDFSSLYLNLSRTAYASLALAQAAGAPTINYGTFINTLVDFLVVAAVVFLLVKGSQRLEARHASPTTRDCPYCLTAIPSMATRCGHCTSQLEPR